MTPNEPFLVLISPSVADVGHAYVIADSMNQPSPGFANLKQQCDFLQKLSRLDDPTACLAVERRVTQWSTSERGAREWLVCSALPQDLKAADKVHAVLRELWSQIYDVKDQAAATWLKKATQKHGDVFHAPRMTEITQRFRNHPQLSGITWLPITSTSSKKALPPQKSRRYNMKHWIAYIGASIALIGLLAWGAPYVFERPGDADDDKKIEAPDADAPAQEEKNWKEWHEVFSSDDRWKKLLAETGGKEAFQAWETAKKAAAVEAEKNNPIKDLFGSKPKQPKGSVPHVLQQQQQVVKKLDEWMTLYGKEFNFSGSSPKDVDGAPMTKYLKQATPPWHRNYDNQISKKGAELPFLKNAGNDLEAFVSIFGKPDSPEQMRAIWKALDAFSKSNPNDDVKPFRDVVKRELESMPAPPENYSILTLKDVERVKRLQIIFGSAEFGLITGRRLEKTEQWNIIKNSVVGAIAQIEGRTGPERALLESLKPMLGNAGSAKPSSPKSP